MPAGQPCPCEGGEDLREEEGAVQDGKVQADAALLKRRLGLLLVAASGGGNGAVRTVELVAVLDGRFFPKQTPRSIAVFPFLFHRTQIHRIPLGGTIRIDAAAFLFWHEDLK